ncbi:putative short chain dehydrogenase [Scheffersomyces coipomensis]|uniref:putative short chain dehydrogenase n=1 Tax=Scheffersomyces coipomensis TaxID=1788519 RepID=UPI00315D184A
MAGQTYFISGGNRGIGFQLVKQFAEANTDNVVIATTRSPARSTELTELASQNKNIHVITLDVGVESSIDTVDSQLKELGIEGIDTFISNAGAFIEAEPTLDTKSDVFINQYRVNTLGPILLFQKVYKYLLAKETRKAVFVSSAGGSLTNFYPFNSTAYGQSKAALNFSLIQLSKELESENFTVVPIHPGGVYTGIAEESLDKIKATNTEYYEMIIKQLMSTEDCGKHLVPLIDGFKKEDSGKFIDFQGKEIPY